MSQEYWYEEQKEQHFSNADKKRKKRTNAFSFFTLIVCMLITGLAGGVIGGIVTGNAQRVQFESMQEQLEGLSAAVSSVDFGETAEVSAPKDTPSIENMMPTAQASLATQYTKAQIVQLCAPSIVGIDVEVPGYGWYGEETTQTGSGSGIILTSDGYIITNNHVIDSNGSVAENIKVYLNDDTEHMATLVGRDERTDLAVIKIKATGLQAVTLGNSESLSVGDDVVAIGNPLGELRGTATSGMISALSRTVNIEGQDMTLLQTDAAINPGNSGGGLFNMYGELVGVVNAKVASSSTEGLGFAIPVNDAEDVVSQLIDIGYVSGRAALGVYMENVTISSGSGRGNNFGLENFFGFVPNVPSAQTRVSVVQLVPNGAAEKAGIQVGDYILAVDDTEITDKNQLAIVIREYNAGDSAIIKILRGTEEMEIPVVFGEKLPD